MKRQYLGDSKDSFKWDYHDFLANALGSRTFKIAWMMTPDDKSQDGKTAPERFPARPEVLDFCNALRETRNAELLSSLPGKTGSGYAVEFHSPGVVFNNATRGEYFSGLRLKQSDLLFLDPDNGFEPERAFSEKHLRYGEALEILERSEEEAIASVFQHHRRVKFPEDFRRIRERLGKAHAAAVYWHSLMFVCISASGKTIERVREINRQYSSGRPVVAID